MKRLLSLIAAAGALAVAACDDPNESRTVETYEPPVEAPVAPAAEDVAATSEETAPADQPPPVDQSTLPTDERSSEESVQPQSETLFY